jgi:hypothetical protein
MRFLLLSSFILCMGCSHKVAHTTSKTFPENKCLDGLRPSFEKVLYNTQVDITSHHLSGLLLMKKTNGDTTRVVFTNEMGISYFDFAFTRTDFKVISCIRKLNKKIVLNQLKKIFGLVLMQGDMGAYTLTKSDPLNFYCKNSGKERTCYITDKACSELKRVEVSSGDKPKITIYQGAVLNGAADSIFVNYQTFKFDIRLKQIDR